MKKRVQEEKKKGRSISFVPTMGAIHEGHLSLVKRAKSLADIVVASVFVNPAQFSPTEDFENYPRNRSLDIEKFEKEGVDLLFFPPADQLYPKGFSTWIVPEGPARRFEGVARPSHFQGVCTIVAKLFAIVKADYAVFGWKDAQQVVVVKKMAEDLNIPIKIVASPILRDSDGLALSSRNVYLSPEERKRALAFPMALQKIAKMVELGVEERMKSLIKEGKDEIIRAGLEIEYLEGVSLLDLTQVEKVGRMTGIIGAVRSGKVRLLDAIIWE